MVFRAVLKVIPPCVQEKAVSRFRPTGKMLGLGLIISVTVSALVCLALLPAERTEVSCQARGHMLLPPSERDAMH